MPAEAPLQYIVCATPRSGSNLLCGGLRLSGVAGNVDEWQFMIRDCGHPDLRGIRARLDYLAAFEEREGCDMSTERFFRRYVEICSAADGAFGVKLFKWDFNFILSKIDEAFRDHGPTIRERLDACFPNARYIYLRREGIVEQAVSLSIAMQTESWTSEEKALRDPAFDFEDIERRREMLERDNREWEEFFAEFGIEPLRLTYEQVRADYEDCILKALTFLGIAIPPGFSPTRPPLKKQASRVNREWIERYREQREALSSESRAVGSES